MNGLRVYVNSIGSGTCPGSGVFYSRRGDGPYYLWRYEEKLANGMARVFTLMTSRRET